MAAPQVNLPDWGPDSASGYEGPQSAEEVERLYGELFDALDWLAHEDNPDWNLAAHIARQLYQQWLALFETWKSGFIGKAEGQQLSALMGFLLESLRTEQTATGYAFIQDDPTTTFSKGSVTLTAENGETATLDEDVTTDNNGYADALFKADQPGPDGNLAANAIASFNGVDTLTNPSPSAQDSWTTFHLAGQITSWRAVPEDNGGGHFQGITRHQIKHRSGFGREVGMTFRSAAGGDVQATLRMDLYDGNGVRFGGLEEIDVTLPTGSGQEVLWQGHHIDVTGMTEVRLAPEIVRTDGPIEVAVDDASNWPSLEAWHENNAPSGYVVAGRIASAMDGEWGGGADAEDDIDGLLRWEQTISAPGFGSPNALQSWLLKQPGVQDAIVRFNPFNEAKPGLPEPKHINVVLDIGTGRISTAAQTIWSRIHGWFTEGRRKVAVTEVGGNEDHLVAMDLATTREVQWFVEVEPTSVFSKSEDVPAIKRELTKFTGGPDKTRTLAQGLRIGEIISIEKAADAVMNIRNADRKLRDFELKVGFVGGALENADLDADRGLGPTDRVRTKPANIDVVLARG